MSTVVFGISDDLDLQSLFFRFLWPCTLCIESIKTVTSGGQNSRPVIICRPLGKAIAPEEVYSTEYFAGRKEIAKLSSLQTLITVRYRSMAWKLLYASPMQLTLPIARSILILSYIPPL